MDCSASDKGKVITDDRGRRVYRFKSGVELLGKLGRYKIVGCIGSGGFACVYKADIIEGGKGAVAIKISSAIDAEDDGNKRIIRESGVMKSCWEQVGAAVPKFIDEGEIDGHNFFVMEHLQKLSWSEGNRWGFPENEDDRRAFVLALVDAVDVIHKCGYVHCDIKPQNLMQRRGDNRVLLVDFGSARPIEYEASPWKRNEWVEVTTKGVIAETPGYGDNGGESRIEKDVFSIGQVIRDCFGKRVGLGWMQIINTCVTRNPDFRYHSLDDLRRDVENVGRLNVDSMRDYIRDNQMRLMNVQTAIAKALVEKVSVAEIREKARKGTLDKGVYECQRGEFIIRCKDWFSRSILIDEGLQLRERGLLVIIGPGVVRAKISACNSKVEDAPTVILINGAMLINEFPIDPNEYSRIRYFLGDSCYLNVITGGRGTADAIRSLIRPDVKFNLQNCCFAVDGPDTIAEYRRMSAPDNEDRIIQAIDFFAQDDDAHSLSYYFGDELDIAGSAIGFPRRSRFDEDVSEEFSMK